MAEEKQLLGDSEAVRDLIVPDFQQRESPTKTERDISNEPQEGRDLSNPEQTCIVHKLVLPTTDGGSTSADNDRSPGRTERDLHLEPEDETNQTFDQKQVTIRDLVTPESKGEIVSDDSDRSPGRTEK